MSATAISTRSAGITWKHAFRVLMSLLVVFLAAALLSACKKGQAEWKKGVSALKEEEYEDAAKQFKESAKKGNQEARLMLALCYSLGMGVDKDFDKAGNQLEKAVESGNPIAQAAYGVFLRYQLERGEEYDEEDLEDALKYLKKSADQDCVFGELGLGLFYLSGGEQAKDNDMSKKGLKYLKKVAALQKTGKKIFLDDVKQYVWDYVEEELLSELKGDKEAKEILGAIDDALKSDELTVTDMAPIAAQLLLATYYGEAKDDYDEAEKWLNKAKKSGLPKKIYKLLQESFEESKERHNRYSSYDRRRYDDYPAAEAAAETAADAAYDDYDW